MSLGGPNNPHGLVLALGVLLLLVPSGSSTDRLSPRSSRGLRGGMGEAMRDSSDLQHLLPEWGTLSVVMPLNSSQRKPFSTRSEHQPPEKNHGTAPNMTRGHKRSDRGSGPAQRRSRGLCQVIHGITTQSGTPSPRVQPPWPPQREPLLLPGLALPYSRL